MAALAGGIGRAMSPIAGAAVICAAFAGVSPIEVAKRNMPGMILACTVSMILLLYM
jgi:DcuC family C4-dicarboxylate transporter